MDVGKINETVYNSTVNNTRNQATDNDFERHLKSVLDNKDEKELKKVCKDFESILLNMVYKEMKATVPKSDFIPEDPGKGIFDSMLDDKLVENASSGQGLGLSDVLYKQLSKQLKSTYKVDK